ncbi:M16 family metallopeptidase [Bacillus fonticola]|uniref:M16 family metallopeptidase n=1 Tax=Bacillus fonticola TaxID=2728853 RepID=UPI00147516DF|nr:pitrilysin family protein [Bacillus fonticola]
MIHRTTLPNGLRVVLENIPTVRSVAIGVWIGTGSRFETTELNGVSHFLEHMLFKGTKTRTARDIAEAFDSIGGQVNAFTSKEYTCYYAKVLDTHADKALDVLSDMFFNSTFAEEEIEKEKQVVFEEIKMVDDTPDDIVHDLLSEASYGDHPLALPILGTDKTVGSFTQQSLFDYQKETYSPDTVVISIAGNVDESFLKQVESLFGHFQGPKKQRNVQQPQFLPTRIHRKKETEQAHVCLGFEGLQVGHVDMFSLIVLNNMLGGSMSSRLFQEVREERGLAYSIFSYHTAYEDSGSVTIYGGTGANRLEELVSTIEKTLATVKETGFTDKELMNCKEQLKGNLMLGLESTNGRMSRNGKNELVLGRHRTLDELVQQIDAVTMADVSRIAHQVFTDQYAVSIVSPKE